MVGFRFLLAADAAHRQPDMRVALALAIATAIIIFIVSLGASE